MMKLIKPGVVFLGLLTLASNVLAQGDAEAGAENVETCVACHTEDGNSTQAMYPKIAGLGEEYLHKQLLDIKSGAREVPQMAGLLEPFSEQELRDLAAFYADQSLDLAGAEEIQVQLNSGEQTDGMELGRNLYRYGNSETGVPSCMGCHGPAGKGNAPAGYPRLGGQFADYIATQLQSFRAGDRTNDEAQVMREAASRLSGAEITAVANYIAGLYAGEDN